MPERLLAAIHDPQRALTTEEARSALSKAFRGQIGGTGITTVAWSGTEPTAVAGVVDGDVAVPAGWTRSWPSALMGLRDSRGAFALIAWDEESRRTLIARDHLGARPLFYAKFGTTLYVASEVAPLLDLLPCRPTADADELARRLAGAGRTAGATLFRGVRELPPAHALLLDDRGWRLARYWRPQAREDLQAADRATAAAALRAGIESAVSRHAARHPGPTGVLTSGGLDSSAVLACAAAGSRAGGRPAPSAWIGVPERAELDESGFARAVAAESDCDAEEVPIPAGPIVPYALAYTERWAVPLEYPGAALFRPVRAAAAARGVIVLLDGEGGDELFGCEPFLIADRLARGRVGEAAQLARALPGMVRFDRRTLGVVMRSWVVPALAPPPMLQWLRRQRSARRPVPDWLRGAARDAAREPQPETWTERGAPRWRSHLAWLVTDSRAALGVHDHLRRAAALDGVRDVHPFLDVDLIELVLGLPPQFAFDARFDRMLLRTALDGLLPEQVRQRQDKVYFGALLRDALTGADRGSVGHVLRETPLALGDLVDRERLLTLWDGGPDCCPRGEAAWMAEIWRVFAFETWLRANARAREY
jgi:asparagine synthase (glutamine-hydrolysing)